MFIPEQFALISDWSVDAEDDNFLVNWGDEYIALETAAFAMAAKFLRDCRNSSGGGGGGGSYKYALIH